MPGLLLALGLAAASPKLIYKFDPSRAADVATVELLMPRHPCFGVTRASVLLSSNKRDRNRIYALSVTVADSPSPPEITGADANAAPLPLVNVRNGDVACTDYQCPVGSAAVFTLDDARKASPGGTLAVTVHTDAGKGCDVPVVVGPSVFGLLDAWADKLSPAAGS